jgi:hypothetical protein
VDFISYKFLYVDPSLLQKNVLEYCLDQKDIAQLHKPGEDTANAAS